MKEKGLEYQEETAGKAQLATTRREEKGANVEDRMVDAKDTAATES